MLPYGYSKKDTLTCHPNHCSAGKADRHANAHASFNRARRSRARQRDRAIVAEALQEATCEFCGRLSLTPTCSCTDPYTGKPYRASDFGEYAVDAEMAAEALEFEESRSEYYMYDEYEYIEKIQFDDYDDYDYRDYSSFYDYD